MEWVEACCRRVGVQRWRPNRPDSPLFQVQVHARVDLPPDAVYAILVHPNNHKVFKAISSVPYRKVVAKEGAMQTVEVDHAARWSLGPLLRGTLLTRLLVKEDRSRHTVAFALRGEPGFMRAFDGEWRVRPFSQAAVDALFRPGPPWKAALVELRDRLSPSTSSLVTLMQRIQPAASPPPPVDGLVRAIAARQVKTLLTDLRAEAGRRAAGKGSALDEDEGEKGGEAPRRPPRPPLLW